ncbi:MAG: endonuclease [Verrucomicrobiaceae bacterium]|nr:endonuclease [Verrucomicrobiaceae bacterium]
MISLFMTPNRYTQILEKIFFAHYKKGDLFVSFAREEIEHAAAELGIKLPKNLGDLIYSFRFRTELPASIRDVAPKGKSWVIKLAGKAQYKFVAEKQWVIQANSGLMRVKIPDSTPGVIARYALDDEQALLALVRYNRLVDVFAGVASYSLQNHLRTTVEGIGQVEVDELYVGIDRRGAHFVFPVQAKGGRDRMSLVQIEQDMTMCAQKFPNLICRPLGAQFLPDGGIAIMEFTNTEDGIRLACERHYLLVPKDKLSDEDIAQYRAVSDAV